ncbi:MAG: beta-propeller fold lactonase family protein, partial [Thermoplasmata archaeon]|nr:beta-propeller fold lactonase family protein [Thermoplasmata archaeon]
MPGNNSLFQGAVNPGYTAAPQGAGYDPASNQVLFGDSFGSNVSILNGSTAAIESLLYLKLLPGHWSYVGSYPVYFAYSARDNTEYITEVGNNRIAFVNATTDRLERSVWSPGGGALAVDPATGDLFESNSTNISILDGRTGFLLADIPVALFAYQLTYDPLTREIWAVQINAGATALLLNDTSFQVARRVTLAEGGISDLVFDPVDGSMIAVGQLGGMYGGGYAMTINASSNSSSPPMKVLKFPSWLNGEAYDPDNDFVYATDGGSVYAIDAKNDTLVKNFTIATDAIAYSPRDHLLFSIGGATNYSIALIDGRNDTVLRFVPYEVVYLEATLDFDNGLVYATTPEACHSPGAVSVFEPGPSPRLLETHPTGDGPSGIAFDPTDHRIFVTNYCSNSLSVYNSSSNSLVRLNVSVGSEPFGVVFDPRLDTLFVAEAGSDAVSELNASSYAVVANYSLPAGDCPYEIGLAGPEQQVYVTNSCGTNISVLDALNRTVAVANLTTGFSSQGVLYDPDNDVVYVANTDANTITYIAARNCTVLGQIRVSNGPTSLAYDPQDDLLFAADTVGSRVSVIDTLRNLPTGPTLPASLNPSGIVFVPGTRQVDLFAEGTGAVNILANTPTIRSVLLDPWPTEVGTPITVGVVAANGSGGYSYAYAGLPPGCVTQDAPVLVCSPTAPGSFDLTVTVADSVGYAWGTEANLTVEGPVELTAFTVQPGVLDLGDALYLSATAAGGVAPFNYTFAGLPPGCVSTSSTNLSCVPADFGTYLVTASVTDSLGREGSQTAVVTVNPALKLLQFGSTPNPVFV